MMSNNSDYTNNLLNQLAYIDLTEAYTPGANLIVTLRSNGADDLADALEAEGYGNYVIKDYVNQNSTNGFAAIAIEDPATGDVGISYRGTENLPSIGQSISDIIFGDSEDIKKGVNEQIDMIDNISTAVTGDSSQAQDALDFFQRNQSDTGNNYLYGHSKGGELALEVYVENYDSIDQVHIINPQPINWASLSSDQLNALNNGKVDAVVINGDLVWLLGGVPYSVRIIQNNGTSDNGFFGPHDLKSASYDPDTGDAIIESNPYRSYPWQGLTGLGLNTLITIIQAGYEVTRPYREWIDAARRFFTEEIPERAREFWESVQDAWQNVKETGLEITKNVEKLISDITDAAKNWWSDLWGKDDDGNSSSSGSAGGPYQFRVDTQLLRQTAARLADLSNALDSLEGRIGSCAQSVQHFSFAGTLALRLSLRGTQHTVENMCSSASKLANSLTDAAELYDKTEKRALAAAKT